MKLYEYLSQLDKNEIEEIGNNLEVIDKFDMRQAFSTSYMINLITKNRLLNEKYVCSLLENKEKFKFNSESVKNIKKIVFGVNSNEEKNVNELKSCGLIFNRCELPEDLKEMLLRVYKVDCISKLENPRICSKHTLFLKLILFINEINNKRVNVHSIENIECKYAKLILSYLKYRYIINIDNESISINSANYSNWLNSKEEIVKDFYCYVFEEINKKRTIELFNNMLVIQANTENWIKIKKIKWLIDEYEEEFYFAVDIGLIIKAEDNVEYIQLHNEVRIILDADISKAHIIVTTDFQVFIEYKDDPLFILMLTNFAKIKNKFYNDDYLLFFDISEPIIKNSRQEKFEEFLKVLKIKCNYIPNLVGENLVEHLNYN